MRQVAEIPIPRQAGIRGQLETAILLWFIGGDLPSIQSLAGNALQLLHDLGRKPGVNKPSILLTLISKLTGRRKHYAELPHQFFKHADRRMKDYEWVGYPTH